MSTQTHFQPSRRTVLRAAAWTAPAVSIAVAAPAYACSTNCSPNSVQTTSLSAVRSRDDRNFQQVVWTFRLKNAQDSPLTNLTVTFSGVSDVNALNVRSGTTTWSGTGMTTRTLSSLAAQEEVEVVATFTRSSNGTGTAVASYFAGSPSQSVGSGAADYS